MKNKILNFNLRVLLSGTYSKYWLPFGFLNFPNHIPSPNLTRENIKVNVFCKVESITDQYLQHIQYVVTYTSCIVNCFCKL